MRKLVALFCLITVLLCGICTEASSETSEEVQNMTDLLCSLGIQCEDISEKDDYIYALAGFMYDEPGSMGTAAEVAGLTGITEATGEYRSGKLTYDDAVKYAVVVLGYSITADEIGDTTFKITAGKLGITKGVTSKKEKITAEGVVRLLYNMLDVEPYALVSNGEYKVLKKETLLSHYRNIYKTEGLMIANKYTSIYGEEGIGKDSVEIDGEKYTVKSENMNDYLGYYLRCYVREDKDKDKELLYIEPKKENNNVLNIESNDISDVAQDYSYMEYEEGTRTKKAKLEPVPRIIYNGVYYGAYTKEDLMPEIGSVTLIDNDSNGKYDVVKVKAYETVAVANINISDGIIRSSCKFEGCIETLEILSEEKNITCKIYEDGEETDIRSIKKGQILSVAKSKNDDNAVVEIIISEKEPTEGEITVLNADEKEITVDGKLYKYNSAFEKQAAAMGQSIAPGGRYIFYFDAFGNAVFIRNIGEKDYKLFLRILDDKKKWYIEYMDMDETWFASYLADRVNFDGNVIKAEEAYERLYESEPQLMLIDTNSKGEIKKIDTAKTSSSYIKGEFIKSSLLAAIRYRSAPNCFDMKYWLNNNAKVVVIPDKFTSDKNAYYTVQAQDYFESDKTYNIVAYDADEFNFTSIMTVSDGVSKKSNSFLLVLASENTYNGEMVYPSLRGATVNYEKVIVSAESADVFAGITPGMVVNVTTDYNGFVTKCTKIADLKQWEMSSAMSAENYYNSDGANIRGTVKAIDLENGRIKIDNGSELNLRLNTGSGMLIYNPDTNKCKIRTAAELKVGDKIMCSIFSGSVSQIICAEN